MENQDLHPADVLNEVLEAVRLRSAIYCRATMTGDWGFRVAQRDHARFHFVKTGSCWIEVDGAKDAQHLKAGDLVILTSGQRHSLRARPDSPVEELVGLLKRYPLDEKRNFLWDNGGAATSLLCGGFRLDEQRTNPLLSTLPPVLIVQDGMSTAISVRSAFELAEAELIAGNIGMDALVSRMSDVIFLQAIRATFTSSSTQPPGLLRGLSDQSVGRALAAMHSRVEYAWTTQLLAKEIGMSRSGFSSRFFEFLGEPPMTYLTRWRLNRAAFLLRSSGSKVPSVALAVGYESEASFSRAFKRCFGLSPGAYRRHQEALQSRNASDSGAEESSPLYPSDFKRDTLRLQPAATRNRKSQRNSHKVV